MGAGSLPDAHDSSGRHCAFVRATANAVVNHMIGRIGMALAPAVVGVVSAMLGSVGDAVAIISLIPFVCLPIILLTVKETKGQELEDIQA